MKLSDSQYPLKKVFYRMFSLLVVVPLIVVFAAAAVILYQVMRTSAVDTISAFQETAAPPEHRYQIRVAAAVPFCLCKRRRVPGRGQPGLFQQRQQPAISGR